MHKAKELVNAVSLDGNKIFSKNLHLGFFQEDTLTPFEQVKITTANNKTIFTVYVKNISQFRLNNFKTFIPTGIKAINPKIPKELLPNQGFFMEFEVNTSKSIERFIQIESKPHSVIFE